MTAQISDKYKYKDREYSVIAMSEPIGFDPTDYGLEPHSASTACWRGYWCDYAIKDEGIILEKLYLFNADDKYPPLNGTRVLPQEFEEVEYFTMDDEDGVTHKKLFPKHMGHRVYEPNMKIDYTGKLVLGDDFIRDYYVHMGFQSAWAYEVVKEFSFNEGRLLDITDHSELMVKYRELIDKDPDGFYEEMRRKIPKFVVDAFSLDFETKAWWLGHD